MQKSISGAPERGDIGAKCSYHKRNAFSLKFFAFEASSWGGDEELLCLFR